MSVPVRDEYVDFCEGIRRLTQIDLLQYKRGQMERRIRSFADRRGIKGLGDYLKSLQASGEELDEFLDRVTINVSQLWRNPEQWKLLQDTLLPELARTRQVRAWSAGCSYGAEAHTLAAICLEAASGARIDIRGTDLDGRMVERARAGKFSRDDARSAPPLALKKWFDEADDGYQARPEIRKLLSFQVGDLLRGTFPAQAYDLVLCRNTVIYFTDDVRDDLHRRLADTIRPGGYLMIGSTERVSRPAEIGLEPAYPFVYRKR